MQTPVHALALQNFTKFTPVGGNQVLLKRAGLKLNHDIVVVGRDQAIATLKMGDLHRFRIGQMQGLLNPFRFIIFQVKNDLCLAVVDDTFAKATFIQIEEIVEVLAREDRRASIPTYRFCNLQEEITGQSCAWRRRRKGAASIHR